MQDLTRRKCPGFTPTEDQVENSCVGCAAGKYKKESGNHGCSLCPGLTTSPRGSTSYTDCDNCPADSLCLYAGGTSRCTCDRRKGARGSGSCKISTPIDDCEISFNSSTQGPFDALAKVSLRLSIRIQTDLATDDSISLILPGFHGKEVPNFPLAVEADTSGSLQYRSTGCDEPFKCRGASDKHDRGVMDCFNQTTQIPHALLESSLEGSWSAEKELLTLTARAAIPVGTRLTVDLGDTSFFLRTPATGLASDSSLITISSSKDLREIPTHLKKMGICSIPVSFT